MSALAVAQVRRGDALASSDAIEVAGEVRFGPVTEVPNHAVGIITRVPLRRSPIAFGDALYWVDEKPVLLLEGSLPMFRDLHIGVADGDDIHQLELALESSGYAARAQVTVDRVFTTATARAIRDWQRDLGVQRTGGLELGDIVFLPEEVRVIDVTAEPGFLAETTVVSVAPVQPQVHVLVPADLAASLPPVEAAAIVRLASGPTFDATVASITPLPLTTDGTQKYEVVLLSHGGFPEHLVPAAAAVSFGLG